MLLIYALTSVLEKGTEQLMNKINKLIKLTEMIIIVSHQAAKLRWLWPYVCVGMSINVILNLNKIN